MSTRRSPKPSLSPGSHRPANLASIDRLLGAAVERLKALEERVASHLDQPPLSNASADLAASLDELHVAREELRRQNEELGAGRKRGESALRRSEELLGLVLSTSPVIMYTCEAGGDYCTTFVSENVRGILGYEPCEFSAERWLWTNHIHPDDRARVVAELPRVLESGVHQYDYRFLATDGSYRWLHDELRLIRDADGSPLQIIGYMADITERRQAGQALRENEERYRRLVDLSPDAIAIHADGKFVFVNPAGARLIGASSPEELIGKPILEVVHPDYHPSVRERVRKATREEARAPTVEEKFVRLDGTVIDVEVTGIPFTFEGKPAMQVVVRDITERKLAEGELRRSEERFKQVAESIGEWIWEVDADGLYTYASPAVEGMLGYTPEEVVGRMHFYDLFVPEREAELREAAFEAFARSKPFLGFVNVNLHKNGSRVILETSGTPIVDERGILLGYRGADTDITERMQAEEALRESEGKHKALIETTDTGYLILDSEGKVADANAEYIRLSGHRTLAEIIGRSVVEWTAEHDRKRNAAEIARCLLRGSVRGHEVDYVDSQGHITSVEINASVVKTDESLRIVSLCRDITRRRSAQEALRQSEEQLRLLFHHAPVGVLRYDSDLRITDCNERFVQLFKSSRERLLGLDMHGLKDRSLLPGLSRAIEGQEGWYEGFYRATTSAAELFVSMRTAPLLDKEGTVRGGMAIFEDITERKRVDTALLAAAREWRSTFDAMGDCVSMLDTDGRILRCNAAMAQRVGKPFAEIVGKKCWEVTHGTSCPNNGCAMDQVRQTHKRGSITRLIGDRWLDITIDPLLDDDGLLKGFVHVMADVTEQRKAEEVIRASEERYRDLVENLVDVVYTVDRSGNITYVSPAIGVMGGYEPSDVLGRRFTDFMHEGDLPVMTLAYRQALRGRLAPSEFRFRTKSGEVRWACVSSRPIREGGRRVGLRGTLTDVTKRKHAEAEVQRLARVVEQASEAVVITDMDGSIQYVNPAFEQMAGYCREEVLGKTPRILRSGRHDSAFYTAMWGTLGRGEVWKGRLTDRMKDGTLYQVESTVSPIRDSAGGTVGYASVSRDITREARLEEQLQQAQKMEAVGRLAGGIAHDFNNLLQAILGYGEMALRAVGPREDLRQDILEIEKAAKRAATLTRQLLAFSRKQMIERNVLELGELLIDAARMLRRVMGEDIEVTTVLEPGLWPVNVDPAQIEHVIMNLAVNARDAMPTGGRLSIGAANAIFADQDVETMPDGRPGRFVCLSVSDTGVGMTPDVMRHLFEPFFTTKGIGKGTGLGLAMAYGIAKQHEGWLHAYSKAGQGSVFRLYLPASSATPEDERREVVPISPARARGERILVVEDEEGVRNLAARVLGAEGYVVVAAASAREAADILDREGDALDLVFTDVVMPDGNGLDIAERLHEQRPGIRIVLTSGYTDERSRWPRIVERGYRFIQKPYAAADLLRMIREALESRSQIE